MSDLTEFRKDKDDYVRQDHHSPLTSERKQTFRGLNYYDERPDLRYVTDSKQYDH